MRNRAEQVSLTEVFASFEQQVHEFAINVVRSIVRQELEYRLDRLRRSIASSPRRITRIARTAKPKRVPEVLAPSIKPPIARPQTVTRKKGWTRDAIVSELATWLVSSTSVDASFITRHGPRGLVAAAKKTFGRFDAALNVASLQVSKMFPDGPPARRA